MELFMDVFAEERWWLTEDGERVKDGDPRARYLLCIAGDRLDPEVFNRIPEAKAIEEAPHNKAIRHHSRKQE
jgi:hypothetical protein